MTLTVELEREVDGRWIAEVLELPGVLVYGADRDEALRKVEAIALRVVADRLDHGEDIPGHASGALSVSFSAAA